MQRRTFMDITLGAATALVLKPWARAEEQERKSLVVYPDPAVEVRGGKAAPQVVDELLPLDHPRTSATA